MGIQANWVKISTNIFSNRKIIQLSTKPYADAIIIIWFRLIILGGLINDNGKLYITPSIPYTSQSLATEFGIAEEIVNEVIKRLLEYNMLDYVDNNLHIKNWNKYQSTDTLNKIVPLSGAERTKAWRARKKDKNIDKKTYGEFGNVILSESEHKQLLEKINDSNIVDTMITSLDTYIQSTGKKYVDHYATILRWYKHNKDKPADNSVNADNNDKLSKLLGG